jgi:hypothetical protein
MWSAHLISHQPVDKFGQLPSRPPTVTQFSSQLLMDENCAKAKGHCPSFVNEFINALDFW